MDDHTPNEPQMGMDRETERAMHEGTELKHMTESEGWAIAKKMLVNKLAILDSVSSLPVDGKVSFEELGRQAVYRAHVVSVVTEWLNEIEGRIDQDEQQKSTLTFQTEEEIIRFHSGK